MNVTVNIQLDIDFYIAACNLTIQQKRVQSDLQVVPNSRILAANNFLLSYVLSLA